MVIRTAHNVSYSGEQSKAIQTYRAGARRCDQQCRERLAELGKPYGQEETVRDSAVGDEEWEGGEISGAGALAIVGIFALYIGFFAIWMLCFRASWLATVLAAWDCSHRDFSDPNTRAIWCVLIVITRWLGALIYYLVVYRHNDPPLAPRPPAPSRHS